jgi:hypothetical protein
MQFVAHRGDEEHKQHVARTHKALAAGHYIEPEGESVRDFVSAGLKQWPDDTDLAKIQSDAAREIVTRAMAARSGGDVAGAHALAKIAHDLDPSDATARLLLAQYDDELVAPVDGGTLSGPRVTLDLPAGKAHVGSKVDFDARITMGGPSRQNHVTGAQFVVVGPGLPGDGTRIPALGTGPYHALFSPPSAGSYDVQFEANVEGATVCADRTLIVVGK